LAVWFVMMLIAGLPVRWVLGVIGGGVALIGLTYAFYENGRHRIDAFWRRHGLDRVDLRATRWSPAAGRAAGFGRARRSWACLEAHTDYIFSVIGEEFGLLMCALVVVLYFAVVARVLIRLSDEEDLFTVLAASGLVAQLGGQAFINILVNLQLFRPRA
jgi:cell division protein FtsW